jgi:hypothetical protein
MPDEVSAGRALSGGAVALPLFSCPAHVLPLITFGPVASSFETHREAMLLRMRSSKPSW